MHLHDPSPCEKSGYFMIRSKEKDSDKDTGNNVVFLQGQKF
jgi:hypothetical protein